MNRLAGVLLADMALAFDPNHAAGICPPGRLGQLLRDRLLDVAAQLQATVTGVGLDEGVSVLGQAFTEALEPPLQLTLQAFLEEHGVQEIIGLVDAGAGARTIPTQYVVGSCPGSLSAAVEWLIPLGQNWVCPMPF